MMRLLWWLSLLFILGFAFVAGAGAAKSLWGGFLILALIGSMYVLIDHDR